MDFPVTRTLATFPRSWRLLRSFPLEQKDPAVFYGGLAEDTAALMTALYQDVTGKGIASARVLDVGGGPGYFEAAFSSRGAHYIGLEPDAGEMTDLAKVAVRGDGAALPFCSGAFDITYSSNVAEHVPDFTALGDEMLRITAPGGIAVLSYTIWLGPFGGHETGLWEHYVGGEFARNRYTRIHGHPPKNVFGTSLFDVSCADGLRWARLVEARGLGTVELAFPRYHPSWAWWLVKVPLVREFLVSNLVLVIRRAHQ